MSRSKFSKADIGACEIADNIDADLNEKFAGNPSSGDGCMPLVTTHYRRLLLDYGNPQLRGIDGANKLDIKSRATMPPLCSINKFWYFFWSSGLLSGSLN